MDSTQVVQEVGALIRGIGELAVYDTALRIGAKLDLLPTQVYLHRGTRDGAAEIRIDPRCPSITVAELASAFAVLEPHEIEDCLCIFKGLLADKPLPPGHGLPMQWTWLRSPTAQDGASTLLTSASALHDLLEGALARPPVGSLASMSCGRSRPTQRPVGCLNAIDMRQSNGYPSSTSASACLRSKR